MPDFEVATLEKIDLNLLINQEPDTVNRFLEALQSTGIFFLDFRNASSLTPKVTDRLVQELYSSADEYFTQPAEVKEKHARLDIKISQDYGYKKSVCDETFEISYNELIQGKHDPSTTVLPQPLSNHTALYKEFMEACQQACNTMLSIAKVSLPAPEAASLMSHHLPTKTSDTALKLIYEPSLDKAADVQENKHCDSGTFTILFYEEWGMHVQDPRTGKWAFTAPEQGCALVNAATLLQRLSGGKFHSPLHRVTQPEDGFKKRYYLSYFFRPAHKG